MALSNAPLFVYKAMESIPVSLVTTPMNVIYRMTSSPLSVEMAMCVMELRLVPRQRQMDAAASPMTPVPVPTILPFKKLILVASSVPWKILPQGTALLATPVYLLITTVSTTLKLLKILPIAWAKLEDSTVRTVTMCARSFRQISKEEFGQGGLYNL